MDRITDYTTLVAGIRELVDLEIGDSVDAFIQFTEQDVGRRVESLWQELTEILAVMQSGTFLTDDRHGILRVSVDTNPLERLHIDAARATYANWTPGRPQAYTVTGGTVTNPAMQHLQFWPPPPDDTSYMARISYKLVIPPLTATNPTNWLISVAPDAYLYGAAMHAVTFNSDETSLGTYGSMYERAVQGVGAEVKRHQSLQKSVSPPGAGGYEHWLP